MKFFRSLVIFFLLVGFNGLNANEDSELSKNKILKNIRCLICQGQSVYDSDSDFSSAIKLVVEDKIQEGLTEKEIYGFLKEKYGEWIIYEPEFNKNNLILWLMPILLFLIGGAIMKKKLIFKLLK
tara:strand:+ start:120 stop:494 length:375 start_codon:yes stop_codon:yes gene_type:complete